MASIAASVERAAFGKVIDVTLKKLDKDRMGGYQQIYDLAAKFMKGTYSPKVLDAIGEAVKDPDNKWIKYANSLLDEIDPNVVKQMALDLGFQAGFYGTKTVRKSREKYQCNIPWLILMDPTSACNMHCKGCWAAEYGNRLNLTFEDMDKIVTEGKELGIYFYMFTGGEPLVRKADVIKLCEKHSECAFNAFTNGTLVDQAFCDEMKRVGNLSLSISLEGFEDANDSRRGEGDFDKVIEAMDLLHKNGLFFGNSVAYTRTNMEAVTSDKFFDMIIEHGSRYAYYFHLMPVGMKATPDNMPTKEQREYIYHRLREVRATKGGKQIFVMDFQNDGEFVGGCIAGGRNYCHINPNGDVEPCVFIHYSGANIHDKSLLECLKQPLFMEYRDNQPFNKNMLRPCPMLENPERLVEMVHKRGAHSTDVEEQESVEHLCDKCKEYAANWEPVADKLWEEHPFHKKGYENFKPGNSGE